MGSELASEALPFAGVGAAGGMFLAMSCVAPRSTVFLKDVWAGAGTGGGVLVPLVTINPLA